MNIKNIRKYIQILLEKPRQLETWRKRNSHNYTSPGNGFIYDNVIVGNETYGTLEVLIHNSDYYLRIGNYCSIAPDVLFAPASEHNMNHLSTFPFRNRIINSDVEEAVSKGDIVISDDVWIGSRAVILSGVHIGQGAVIAANAVVDKDVEPYSVVGGVPAKTIKLRFTPDVISFLCTLDYSKLTEEMIRSHIDDLYVDLNNMELEKVEKLYDWFPKKNTLK